MKRRRCFCACLFVGVAVLVLSSAAFGCSSKGPQDPYTGLITYPPGNGSPAGVTSVPVVPGTPFNGTFYKAWNAKNMQVIIVPVGTQLSFEGVIKSATPLNPPRPNFWEEGQVNNEYGTTVENAPRPTWTISGNGRGDFRGDPPPPLPGGLSLKPFETRANCMIVDDTPAVKALWKLTYDQDAALNMLWQAYNDPVYKSMIDSDLTNAGFPEGTDFSTILQNAREPEFDFGAKSLNEYEISPTGPDGVAGLRNGLVTALPHDEHTGCLSTEDPVTRTFKKPGGATYSVSLPSRAKYLVKAGYIAMQEWYPSGRYNTKYLITPPSGTTFEYGNSRLVKKFTTPTAPDYWVLDLNSGLESCKDCVWCWIEATGVLKPEESVVPEENYTSSDPSKRRAYYQFDPNSVAIGGVFVRGYYQAGASTAGRNTLVYVVVVDTERPATFDWLTNQTGLTGETGKTLGETMATPLKFRIYDNNPLLGANTHNSIFTEFPNLASFEFIQADKRPGGGPNVTSVYTQYLAPLVPTAGGVFSVANLKPAVYYNVCVPCPLGFKVSGVDPAKYAGPFPLLRDRLVVPAQRFVWKKIDTGITITGRQIYKKNGAPVSDLAALQVDTAWDGYSSVDFTVDSSAFVEPMGVLFGEGAKRYDLKFADAKIDAPSVLPTNGVPVLSDKIQFYPWSDKGIKVFPSVQDGVGNQSPVADEVNAIIGTKFSGIDLKDSTDRVSQWSDPAGLDGSVSPNPIMGGLLEATLPAPRVSGVNPWGKFLYVKEIKDRGRPMVALEITNAKSEKAVVYGNLAAMGDLPGYYTALEKAGGSGWAVANDTNVGSKFFTAAGTQEAEEAWEFKAGVNDDLYLRFQECVSNGKFRPWMFAVPNNTPVGFPAWGSDYWNGKDTYNNDRIAYQQGNRDRLLFRYWAWDNINMFNTGDAAAPCGVKLQPGDRDFNAVCSDKRTALVTLIDKPVYSTGDGKVPASKVWWPDYIFQNPSHRKSGDYEECSITLEVQDEANNPTRKLKVFFRVPSPAVEMIRTLEDNRERR